jgi:predicted dehydrogenase
MSEPNKTVRWGVLSTAHIATKVSRAIRLAGGTELVAVASRTQERADAWANKHEVARAYGSYEALLNDPSIDAIYNPLPPSMHLEWTVRAAEHGKHVLCEKPLAANTAQAIEMADACRKHGVQLMDGVMWVHHERTVAMRRHIDDGSLGKLRHVSSAFSFHWEEIPNKNIRLQKDLAGGSLGDLGYYCVRAIGWALGDLPRRVFATARYFHDVDMNLTGVLWFDGERSASFNCGFDTVYRKWFEVAGTHGSLVCDDFVVPWKEETARYWTHDAAGKPTEHRIDGCVQEARMIEHFSDAVRSGKLNEQWPADAIATMRVCDALAASARSNQVVELSP